MSRIAAVNGREVLDSRGNPTVEVEVRLENGIVGCAIVPSGASVGSYEATELRDDDASRYAGKGVLRAVRNVNETISAALHDVDVVEQGLVDSRLIELDGTDSKSNLGANATLGTSLAALDAAAQVKDVPLYRHVNDLFENVPMRMPVPLMNILNGGAHANNDVVFQEFMVLPVGGGSFREALRIGVEVFHALKRKLQSETPPRSTAVGDEGGFAPNLDSNRHALDYLVAAISDAGHAVGEDCLIGIDCAATEFHGASGYAAELGESPLSGADMVKLLREIRLQYPAVISIEDGCSEETWDDWQALTDAIGATTQLVGDDIFVTNVNRLQKGFELGVCNSILVKLNQVGTVSETLDVVRLAQEQNYTTVISHRSGDTEDTKIADIAVGTGAGQIKTGSASRSERVAKYNRLLRIEEDLHPAIFKGAGEFADFKRI